jgi:hypothetical protein
MAICTIILSNKQQKQAGEGKNEGLTTSGSEAAQPKEALVAPVLPIKAVALPMMDTGSGQMHDPPHGDKHRQEQPTRPFAISNQAGFQIPVTALGILEGCGLSACARHIPARVAALLADRK